MNSSKSQSDLFRLLSILMRCPTMEIAQGITKGTIETDFMDILQELSVAPDKTSEIEISFAEVRTRVIVDSIDFFSLLRQEYTRLFVVPHKAVIPIYEAIFRMTPETVPDLGPVITTSPAALDAKNHYRRSGVELTIRDSADHMAIELEFAGYLYDQLARVQEEQKFDRMKTWNSRIDDFNQQHLDRWMYDFFSVMQEQSKHPFYRMLGLIVRSLFVGDSKVGHSLLKTDVQLAEVA